MSKQTKRNIINVVFLVVVFGLTLYGVFRGENLQEVLDGLGKCDPVILIAPCIICVLAFHIRFAPPGYHAASGEITIGVKIINVFPLILRKSSIRCFEKVHAHLLTGSEMKIPAVFVRDTVILHIVLVLDYDGRIVHEVTVFTDRGSVLESTIVTSIDFVCPSHLWALLSRFANRETESHHGCQKKECTNLPEPERTNMISPFQFRASPAHWLGIYIQFSPSLQR